MSHFLYYFCMKTIKQMEVRRMPLGLLVNCGSVVVGGLLGCIFRKKMPQKLFDTMPTLFGYCALAIGIYAVVQASTMVVVVLAILLGFSTGHFLGIEERTKNGLSKLTGKLRLNRSELDMDLYIGAVVIFCCSGFGIFGVLTESIQGNSDVLFSKSILDFFTAMLFGALLGKAMLAIPFIQLAVMLCVFLVGKLIAPSVDEIVYGNFAACGGILTIATGLRVSKIKSFPIIDMAPSLVWIILLTHWWAWLFV